MIDKKIRTLNAVLHKSMIRWPDLSVNIWLKVEV